MDAALAVLTVMFNILSPSLAPNVDYHTISWLHEFHHYQWRPIAFLVQVRVVVDRKSLRRIELQRAHVFLVYRIFALTSHTDVEGVPAAAKLWRSVGLVVHHRLPVKDLVELQQHARLSPVVAVVTLPRALRSKHVNQEPTGSVAWSLIRWQIFTVDECFWLLHLVFIQPKQRLDVIGIWLVTERLALHEANQCTSEIWHRSKTQRWKSL